MDSEEGRALSRRFQREHARDQHLCGCPKEHFSSCPLSPFYCVECGGTRRTWVEDDNPKGLVAVECWRCSHLYGGDSNG